MRPKFIYSLLLSALTLSVVSCAEDSTAESDLSMLANPFTHFEYVTADGFTFTPEINDSDRSISIYEVEDSETITAINYELKPGVSISPDPSSRVGSWRETELFLLTMGDEKAVYETTLVDFYHAYVERDAILYPQQTYGRKIDTHLYDLKYDITQLSNTSNCEEIYGTWGCNGVRFPIWGATDPATGECGHVTETSGINWTVYERFFTRTQNALDAFIAAGNNKDDFIVFISTKSTEPSIPAWCYDNYDNESSSRYSHFEPAKFTSLVMDLVREIKSRLGLDVHVIGLDNESALASASLNSTTFMYYETVALLRVALEKEGYYPAEFISTDAWEPKAFTGKWFDTLLGQHPETVDMYGIHYYHDKDHPNHFDRLEAEWDASAGTPHPTDGSVRKHWATEPHWYSMSQVNSLADYKYGDFFKASEQAMCTIFAHSDLGLNGFCWWSMTVGTTLRHEFMKLISLPILGGTPIKAIHSQDEGFSKDDSTTDNVCRYYSMDDISIKMRAFVDGNKVTLFVMYVPWYESREEYTDYTDYVVGLVDSSFDVINNTITYERIVGTDDGASAFELESGEFTAQGDEYFKIDIPVRSVTVYTFEVVPSSSDTEE